MKDHVEVVKERYDQQMFNWKAVKENIYSMVNPIGFYGGYNNVKILTDFIHMLDSKGINMDKLKICDCGCGGGFSTRVLSELLESPEQIYGTEYSKTRLRHCIDMNNRIHYAYGDLTARGGIPFEEKFDGITAFVVFMHFTTGKQIMNGLRNIYEALRDKGLFLWYDCNAKSHKQWPEDADGWGFSEAEMDYYASKAGFKLVREYGIYSKIPFFNNIPTVYLAEKVKSMSILSFMEKLPFEKNNNVRIYQKN